MIHYQLRCGSAHEFDGWFAGSDAFERQAERHLIACPVCAGTDVTRALMAPRLNRKGGTIAPPEDAASPAPTLPAPVPAPVPAQVAAGRLPDGVRAALTRLRAEVEAHCDYVGTDFADEARRIHEGKAPARGIYGESTDEQAEELAEEGINIARIPWVPRADS